MEQVAWSKSDRGLVLVGWRALVLALLFLGALALGGSDVLAWSAAGLTVAAVPVVLGAALLLCPGLALVHLFWHGRSLARGERLALALGLSVVPPPLLLLAAHVAGLRWSAAATWGYLLISVVICVGATRPLTRWRARQAIPWHLDLPGSLLLGLTLCALLARLYAVRDLPAGLWGDSYQHTLIAQLLVDNGGIFASWRPYAPLATFTYHYGFHASVAFFHWLTGVDVPHSLLWIGQALNAATIPLAYLLTVRLSGERWAGVWAALITGFVSTTPAYYVNWGRYTQLAGQVVLPALLVCWIALLESERRSWRQLALAGLTTAAMLCTHYRVAVFAACFLIGYGILLLCARRPAPRQLVGLGGWGLGAAGLGLALAAPWLINIRTGQLVQVTTTVLANRVDPENAALANAIASDQIFTIFTKTYLLALAIAGVVRLVWARSWRMGALVLWVVVVLLAANPNLVGLPGAGLLTNFAALIALYLVVAPLAGYALAWGQQRLPRHPVAPAVVALAVAGACAWGLAWQARIVDRQAFMLVGPADAQAMAWIGAHTPPDARFLADSMFVDAGTALVGTDAGWWIPLLARRGNTVPPRTYLSERPEQPDYVEQVNTFGRAIQTVALASPEGVRLLCGAGVRYIYSGQRADSNGHIDRATLARSPLYRQIYNQGGVAIFELVGPCP
jgi:hypothetical protein